MSKQQLTIEHLAPYLPYKLKMKFEGEDFEHELVGLDITEHGLKLISVYEDYGTASLDSAKPILRPLSDLTKEIEHNGEKFIPWHELEFGIDKDLDIEIIVGDSEYLYISYTELRNEMQKLFEWHFDVFDLHSKGLCIYKDEI